MEETALQNLTEYQVTVMEAKLLEVLLNPEHANKTVTDICKIAGCTRTTYYAAMNKPEFVDIYEAKTKDLVKQAIAPVVNTFIKKALEGSYPHGKVVLEMAGLYSEKSQLEISGDFNFHMSREERQERIRELLAKKAAEPLIQADYKVIDDGLDTK